MAEPSTHIDPSQLTQEALSAFRAFGLIPLDSAPGATQASAAQQSSPPSGPATEQENETKPSTTWYSKAARETLPDGTWVSKCRFEIPTGATSGIITIRGGYSPEHFMAENEKSKTTSETQQRSIEESKEKQEANWILVNVKPVYPEGYEDSPSEGGQGDA